MALDARDGIETLQVAEHVTEKFFRVRVLQLGSSAGSGLHVQQPADHQDHDGAGGPPGESSLEATMCVASTQFIEPHTQQSGDHLEQREVLAVCVAPHIGGERLP